MAEPAEKADVFDRFNDYFHEKTWGLRTVANHIRGKTGDQITYTTVSNILNGRIKKRATVDKWRRLLEKYFAILDMKDREARVFRNFDAHADFDRPLIKNNITVGITNLLNFAYNEGRIAMAGAPPGTGKSYLLRHLVKDHEEMVLVEASEVTSGQRIIEEIGHAVQADMIGTYANKMANLADALRKRKTWVVIDEAQILEPKGFSLIVTLYNQCPQSRFALVGHHTLVSMVKAAFSQQLVGSMEALTRLHRRVVSGTFLPDFKEHEIREFLGILADRMDRGAITEAIRIANTIDAGCLGQLDTVMRMVLAAKQDDQGPITKDDLLEAPKIFGL